MHRLRGLCGTWQRGPDSGPQNETALFGISLCGASLVAVASMASSVSQGCHIREVNDEIAGGDSSILRGHRRHEHIEGIGVLFFHL